MDYFKKWPSHTSVCYPPYDWLSCACDILVFKFSVIYKIKLKEKQLFTCQVCFQSYRVHRDNIDKINIFLNKKNMKK